MVPDVTTCDNCGRTVIILCWEQAADEAGHVDALVKADELQIKCTIDCPICGTRIQSVELRPMTS